MRTIVINTGTELLLGEVINSHLSFIAREILPLGLRVDRQFTVPDGSAIREAVSQSLDAAEIIFITGGLGPTTDDVTREVVADLLELELKPDMGVMDAITARAALRGFKLTDRTSRQSLVPRGATVLPNEYGSAPGLYLSANPTRQDRPHLFLLPGPPRELHPMFRNQVWPILRKITPEGLAVGCKTYRIVGIGESLVEEAIGERLLEIPGIELGYCARPGEVDLRIIGQPQVLDRADEIIRTQLGNAIFSRDGRNLEETVIGLLGERKKTLAIVESCTGGYLAHRITNVPGASAVFLAGYVTYSNEAKTELVKIDPNLILKHGAVSVEVARAMAEGARQEAKAALALATTGIAGPGGGTDAKPVGTVFIALASDSAATTVERFLFPDDRRTFKELASQRALEMARLFLLGEPAKDR